MNSDPAALLHPLELRAGDIITDAQGTPHTIRTVTVSTRDIWAPSLGAFTPTEVVTVATDTTTSSADRDALYRVIQRAPEPH